MTHPLILAEILAVLDDPRSVPDLQRYFLGVGGAAFSGGQFERLGGSDYRPEIANTVTAEDLIAVQLLSVQVRPRRALDLLQGELGRNRGVLAQRLRALRAEADLPAAVSRLRVLDVVFWMRHRDAHGGGACPGLRLT